MRCCVKNALRIFQTRANQSKPTEPFRKLAFGLKFLSVVNFKPELLLLRCDGKAELPGGLLPHHHLQDPTGNSNRRKQCYGSGSKSGRVSGSGIKN